MATIELINSQPAQTLSDMQPGDIAIVCTDDETAPMEAVVCFEVPGVDGRQVRCAMSLNDTVDIQIFDVHGRVFSDPPVRILQKGESIKITV